MYFYKLKESCDTNARHVEEPECLVLSIIVLLAAAFQPPPSLLHPVSSYVFLILEFLQKLKLLAPPKA